MSRLNLNLKMLGEILVNNMGDQSSFTMSRLNLNLKILGEILVNNMGNQSSFTMSRLNLNLKILGEILVRSIIFHHVQAKSELKNFRQDSGLQTQGGVNHPQSYHIMFHC